MKKSRKWILCYIVFIFTFLLPISVSGASDFVCLVRFYLNEEPDYPLLKELNETVPAETVIVLPKVSVRGYSVLGWTTEKGAKKAELKPGEKIKISKNTRFYLVRKKKKYKVCFFRNSGKSNASFQALEKTVTFGKKIRLPAVPEAEGYQGMGWTTERGSDTVKYQSGAVITVKKNCNFYAVYKKLKNITFYSCDGEQKLKTLYMDAGTACVLPSVESPRGKTFLGWSTSPGQTTAPKYLAGQEVIVNKNRRLYAVCYPCNKEANLTEKELGVLDLQKYTKVIFVGDSRTEQASRAFQALYGGENSSVFANVSFVALSGSGLKWFRETGYENLKSEIGEGGTDERPIAVIMNHGVNDLKAGGPDREYVSTMLEVARELQPMNVKLFYMSVNPMNRADYEDFYSKYAMVAYLKYEDRLLSFNQMLKQELCSGGAYEYLDCFTYLMKTGFSYDSGKKENGINSGKNDGIHYSVETYKRIYTYCIQMVNQSY